MNLPTSHGGPQLPADPSQLNDYYKQYAEAYAETERRAGSSITLRNGIMSVGDQAIPGNQFAGIVLDAVRLNTYYASNFNPNSIEPPICYAIGRNDMEMAPHPDMAKSPYFQPQSPRCSGCPHNEFGSARQGQGKACGNRRRLLILVAGTYQPSPQGPVLQPITDLSHYATSALLTLSVAPTSAPGWGAFVRDSMAKYQRPPFGMIARIYLYPHPKHGKEAVGFEPLAPLPDDWAPTVLQRFQEAQQEIMQGFEAPRAQPAQQQRGGGFYGAQQQVVNQGLGQGVPGHPGFAW